MRQHRNFVRTIYKQSFQSGIQEKKNFSLISWESQKLTYTSFPRGFLFVFDLDYSFVSC